MTPQRPRAALAAASLAVVCAGLLLGSVVVLLVHTLTAGAGSSADRWSTGLGALLTCTLAGLGALGAVSLLGGTGRALLLTAAWVQAGLLGVALVAAGSSLVTGSTSAGTGVVVLAGCAGGLALAAATVRLGQRRDVAGWLESSAAWRTVAAEPAGHVPSRAAVAVLTPVVLLVLGTAVALTVAPDVRSDAGVHVPAGVDLGPAGPPPASGDPEWSAEFAPGAEACSAGSMTACDDLYWESSVEDGYERYGSTCGGRLSREVQGGCVALLGRALN